jgi:hypothetical protein
VDGEAGLPLDGVITQDEHVSGLCRAQWLDTQVTVLKHFRMAHLDLLATRSLDMQAHSAGVVLAEVDNPPTVALVGESRWQKLLNTSDGWARRSDQRHVDRADRHRSPLSATPAWPRPGRVIQARVEPPAVVQVTADNRPGPAVHLPSDATTTEVPSSHMTSSCTRAASRSP